MNVLSFQNYSWLRIFRTSEGNENWFEIWYFEKSGVTKITVSDWGEGNNFCFELSGVSKKWGFKSSVFNYSYFSWNLAYYLTSIDCLVKSKPYQRNSKFFLVREVQENFETALCGAINWKRLFSEPPQKSLQPRIKVLRHFNAVFNFAPSNHRVQKEQIRPLPPSPPLGGNGLSICDCNRFCQGKCKK